MQVLFTSSYHMITFNNIGEIKKLLHDSSVIAVVGLSPKPERPSNMVGRYLMRVGYQIIPVNPGQSEIFGQPCYPDLLSIPGHVDIVNIFRQSDKVPPIVEQATKLDCLGIWMQQGIVNEPAAQTAREHGKIVVMDRCIKIDHTAFLQNG